MHLELARQIFCQILKGNVAPVPDSFPTPALTSPSVEMWDLSVNWTSTLFERLSKLTE